MNVTIEIATTDQDDRCFVTWAPVRAQVRMDGADTAVATHRVTLRNAGTVGGGQVNFDAQRGDAGDETLTLDLASNGTAEEIWVAGEFGVASRDYGDAVIEAVDAQGAVVGRRALMVRVRKDAATLSDAERDRFLEALATLNDAGDGPFRAFRDMHVRESAAEAHGAAGFLPWHRAYLLDLERSLQEIDAAVALPYWRFDRPAPALFAPDFFGMPSADPADGDVIEFPHGHPLEFWRTDTVDRVERRPLWDIDEAPPTRVRFPNGVVRDWVISQADTFDLGGPAALYSGFRDMETAPHGFAHTSFAGPIGSVPTAAKDPLFFLLHANVDRLWAFWQWLNRRTAPGEDASYSLLDSHRPPDNLGHKLDDTMWPWNGETASPRPNFPPPRGAFPGSPFSPLPGPRPRVRDMIDLHGVQGGADLGFSYDDVPFEL